MECLCNSVTSDMHKWQFVHFTCDRVTQALSVTSEMHRWQFGTWWLYAMIIALLPTNTLYFRLTALIVWIRLRKKFYVSKLPRAFVFPLRVWFSKIQALNCFCLLIFFPAFMNLAVKIYKKRYDGLNKTH